MRLMTFLVLVLAVAQLLHFSAARALLWQFKVQTRQYRRWGYAACFALGNGLLLATLVWRVLFGFRLSAFWLVWLLYVCLTAAAVVGLWCVLRILRLPARFLRVFSVCFFVGLVGLSLYNAYMPVVRRAAVTIDKPLAKPVRIGMAADLHLGILVGKRQLRKLADIMKQERVDVILLPGDLMDDDTVAFRAEHMQPELARLRAPLGVFATLGNHDVRNRGDITRTVEASGIRMLNDEAVWVDSRFWVVGRPDDLIDTRLPVKHLLQKTDTSRPVFLLDHRPDEVDAHSVLPIDVQVSGHVHNGQIFPANFIVRFLNRLAYGYEHIGHVDFFVTSGFGFWGVPFRLGSQSEVWIIDVKGQ